MIDAAELKRRLDAGRDVLVLDVRGGDEYTGELGHIHGSVNIPLAALQQRLDELGDRLAQPVAIVCRTDRRSAKAAALLARKGFSDVHVVRGGMMKWNEAGLPVEGAAPPATEPAT
jgi:rhodanese-related sulfurtransferase